LTRDAVQFNANERSYWRTAALIEVAHAAARASLGGDDRARLLDEVGDDERERAWLRAKMATARWPRRALEHWAPERDWLQALVEWHGGSGAAVALADNTRHHIAAAASALVALAQSYMCTTTTGTAGGGGAAAAAAAAETPARTNRRWWWRAAICDAARLVARLSPADAKHVLGRLGDGAQEVRRCVAVQQRALHVPTLLYRAEYARDVAALRRDGFVAKAPLDQTYTWQQHVEQGARRTRYISFTKLLAVALYYWAKAYVKSGEQRLLLVVDTQCDHLRAWLLEDATGISDADGGAAARAKFNAAGHREIVLEPAAGVVPAVAIVATIDCARAMREDSDFARLVRTTQGAKKTTPFNKFAACFLDYVQQHPEFERTYRVPL